MPITVRPTTTPIKAPASIDNLRFTNYTDVNKGALVLEVHPTKREKVYGYTNAGGKAKLFESTDGMLTGTLVKDFNVGVANVSQELKGMLFLPNGEAMVTIRNPYTQADGGIFVSTGFQANPLTATWARTLTYSNSGNYCLACSWDAAPAGHIREGLVVVTEYGGQSNQASTNVNNGASRVWVSLDYGQTWREIFNLLKTYGTKNQHMHGVAYDPYSDNILMCFGDGYAGAPAVSGTMYTDNWLDDTPTWKAIIPVKSAAAWQLTLMKATPAGIICGSDGGPDGIWFMARDSRGGYKFPEPIITNIRSSWIGSMAYQSDPSRPTLLVFSNGQSNADPVRVFMIAARGDQIDEVYCDTQLAPVWGGAWQIVGPDRDGYVYWTANDGRSVRTLARGTLNYAV